MVEGSMLSRSVKTIAIGLVAAAMASVSAQAVPLPNLTNLNFLSYSGASPKNSFSAVNPTGWTGGSGLIFIDQPGNASNPNSACGSIYLQTYGCPSTLAIPGGYNYVEADGNPAFESGFNYLVTGLTPGQTYTLSFYQAASQQTTFADGVTPTTEQWIVSLGTEGMKLKCCGPVDPLYGATDLYYNDDPNASVVATNLMTTPSGGLTDWNYVSIELTADSTSDLLSFLAWADKGSTVNVPPIVFLAGVNSQAGLNGVPEPATLSLIGAGIGGIYLRRRAKRKAAE
jgi:hypothetical protein